MTTTQPRVRDLTEDLEAVGLDGIDFNLMDMEHPSEEPSPLAESDAPEAQVAADPADPAPAEESDADATVDRIVQEVFDLIRPQVEDEEIDYDEDEFDEDLKQSIRGLALQDVSAVEEEEGLSEEEIVEARVRRIAKLVGGRLKMVRQKLRSKADRRKDKMKRRRKKGKIRQQQRKYRRSPKFKRYQRRVKKARARATGRVKKHLQNESNSAVSRILSLLSEADASGEQASMTPIESELDEAYGRLWRIADTLASFFEDLAEEEDFEISTAMTEMVRIMESDIDSLVESGAGDLHARLERLQKYGKAVFEALDEFEKYSVEEADDDDDDHDDDHDDYDEDDFGGND